MTSDDNLESDLVARLRRTLRAEADAVTLGDGGAPGEKGRSAPGLVSGSPVGWRRPRWPLAAVAAALVTVGVVLAALNWPSGGGADRVHVDTNQPAASNPAVRPPSSSMTAPPTTARPATAPAGNTATTLPPTALPGFEPDAVTFVTPDQGWVLGSQPCASGRCLRLARTGDAGRSWQAVTGPAADLTGVASADVSVRFADPSDGWIYVDRSMTTGSVWSTHDGGRTWAPVDLPVTGFVEDLETAAGQVDVAVLSSRGNSVHVETSPASADHFRDSTTTIPVGAGPVPEARLVAQGTAAWVVENDRVVVGGARRSGGGGWSTWTPPCSGAYGPAVLAASSSTDLYALCHEGDWGTPTNLAAHAAYPSTWLFRSTDGGASFEPVGPVTSGTSSITSGPVPTTVIVAGTANDDRAFIRASVDGGASWSTVYAGAPQSGFTYVGMTTATQGVAIETGPSGSELLMTRDSGRHWAAVTF